MKRSGYDNADPEPNVDWAYRDEKFAAIEEGGFVQHVFRPIPALVDRADPRHSRRYDGQPFDESLWELVHAVWDHEHCDVCRQHIWPDMTYWVSAGPCGYFLCDRCHDRYVVPPGASRRPPARRSDDLEA